MEFVQAQFSLKFEPQIKIRRSVNDIEDFLLTHYGTPQMMPLPDDFAAEAPRIVLNSHHGHSQISFSQISVDFSVNFDDIFRTNFELTQKYITERVLLLKELLLKINIPNFYFCGVTYIVHLDTDGKSNIEYIGEVLNESDIQNMYEASRRIASVKSDKYFINEQIGTYKEYQGIGNIPNLLDFKNSKLVDEGINLTLDINDRYEYLKNGRSKSLDCFEELLKDIFKMIKENLEKWR